MTGDARMMLWFDGGCKPNPGMMEIGVVAGNGYTYHERIGRGTNNEAEWFALLAAMNICQTFEWREVSILGDSQLVVNQANGIWRVKKMELMPYSEQFKAMRGFFDLLDIQYVPRAENRAGHLIEDMN